MKKNYYELIEVNGNNLYNLDKINITKDDFFDSIKNHGYNIEDTFEGIGNYPIHDIELNDYNKIHEIINDFINQAIKNFYNKIEGKKYYPPFFYIKFIIQLIFIILLILPFFIKIIIKRQLNFNEIKEKFLNKATLRENIIYAVFEIKRDYKNYTLFIKSERFNRIHMNISEKEKITYIKFENHSKIFGNCSYLFSNFTNCKDIEIEKIDTKDVTHMDYMFLNDKNLTTLNLSNFTTSNTISMIGMFFWLHTFRIY